MKSLFLGFGEISQASKNENSALLRGFYFLPFVYTKALLARILFLHILPQFDVQRIRKVPLSITVALSA